MGYLYIYTYLLENLSSTDTIQTYDILCTTSLNVVLKYAYLMVVVALETRWPSETKIICFVRAGDVRGHFGMVNELPYIIYDLSPFGYICMMMYTLRNSFPKFVFVFTLALCKQFVRRKT